jgi:hypothetical protein
MVQAQTGCPKTGDKHGTEKEIAFAKEKSFESSSRRQASSHFSQDNPGISCKKRRRNAVEGKSMRRLNIGFDQMRSVQG